MDGLPTLVTSLVLGRGATGLTVAELREIARDHHHGTLSGCLSNLHRDGTLALLTEKRKRCHVYVSPVYVKGRTTRPHASERAKVA